MGVAPVTSTIAASVNATAKLAGAWYGIYVGQHLQDVPGWFDVLGEVGGKIPVLGELLDIGGTVLDTFADGKTTEDFGNGELDKRQGGECDANQMCAPTKEAGGMKGSQDLSGSIAGSVAGTNNGSANMNQVTVATTGVQSGTVRFSDDVSPDGGTTTGDPQTSSVNIVGHVTGPVKLTSYLQGELKGTTSGSLALNGSVSFDMSAAGAIAMSA